MSFSKLLSCLAKVANCVEADARCLELSGCRRERRTSGVASNDSAQRIGLCERARGRPRRSCKRGDRVSNAIASRIADFLQRTSNLRRSSRERDEDRVGKKLLPVFEDGIAKRVEAARRETPSLLPAVTS